MKKTLRFWFVALMAMVVGQVFAQNVTLDFTITDPADETGKTSAWGFPASSANKTVEAKAFIYDGYTVVVAGSEGQGYYWHDKDHYLLLGKQGATLTLPVFDFDVECIEIEGNSGASANTKQNIFVGDEAVSTETTGAQGTNIFQIAEGKQAAGTIYTLKVTSNHNDQIKTIKIYKKGSAPDTPSQETQEINVAKALEIINALEDGKTTSEEYIVKGFVVGTPDFQRKADGTLYGNVNFDMADEKGGTAKLTVFRAKDKDNVNFTEETITSLKENDEVVMRGKLQKYVKNDVVTPELTNGYVISVTSGETPATQGKVWDFTKWSAATVAALKADAAASKTEGWSDVEKKADAEAGADPTEASKDNCFWSVAEPNADGTLSANGVVIEELKGLKFFSVYSTARSLAIAVNYPSTSLGEYAGPAYLWLGGGKKKVPCFAIADVAAGSTITMEVESHKPAEGRGVELYSGLSEDGKTVDDATKIGDTFNPKTLESHSWNIEKAGDVIVYNTNGCHIYKITIGEASAIVNMKADEQAVKGIFNLAGQRLEKAQKGLNIINGKKVMVK